MSSRRKKTGGIGKEKDDEVEELLRAAEDEMLLNLTLNSHMSRGSSNSYIDPDLDLRFQALKSSSSSSKPSTSSKKQTLATTLSSPPQTTTKSDKDEDDKDGDDLFARFAALKSSRNPHKSTPKANGDSSIDRGGDKGDGDDDGVDEDEVQKVIRWAMDAARLDPSPRTDDDDDDSDGINTSDDEDDCDSDDKVKHGKKGRPK